MPGLDPDSVHLWQIFTRLGEIQLLLPAAALVSGLLLRQAGQRPVARAWLLRLAVAAALTTASKLAFIGWGWGWATLDFTGISGHAMFAAAIYPVLVAALVPAQGRSGRQIGAAAGAVLAMALGLSRLMVDAHSLSEVVAGLLVGGAAGLMAWRLGRQDLQGLVWLAPAVALWLLAAPWVAPPSHSHSLVTRLALALSGQQRPYTRDDLRAGRPRASPAARWPAQSPGAPAATAGVAPSDVVIGPLPL
jgi:membrane-associated phospholipid phosphatase